MIWQNSSTINKRLQAWRLRRRSLPIIWNDFAGCFFGIKNNAKENDGLAVNRRKRGVKEIKFWQLREIGQARKQAISWRVLKMKIRQYFLATASNWPKLSVKWASIASVKLAPEKESLETGEWPMDNTRPNILTGDEFLWRRIYLPVCFFILPFQHLWICRYSPRRRYFIRYQTNAMRRLFI